MRRKTLWYRWLWSLTIAFFAVVSGATAQEPAPATPGPEHDVLNELVGHWTVTIGDEDVGTATALLRLGGRFLEVELDIEDGPITHSIYTFGHDRRHGHYTVIAMDDTGTYAVTAQGERVGDRIPMYGQDDEPLMTAMGFEKEFVIELQLVSKDSVVIETRLIDNRTSQRTEMPFLAYKLRR